MSELLEPLDVDVMAVLTQARPMDEVTGDARARVWAAVQARAALVPGDGNGGQGGGGGGEGFGTPAEPNSVPHGKAAEGVLGAWVGRHPMIALAGALLVGGAIGAGVRGGGDARVAHVEPLAASVVAITAPPEASAWIESPREAMSSPLPPPVTEPRPAPTAPRPAQQLAAESALLDLARTAIARGEADHAIAAVDRHASTFPQGMLREEREALGVKALVLAGRGDEARARAAKLRARYPESLFLPAIESSLRSLP